VSHTGLSFPLSSHSPDCVWFRVQIGIKLLHMQFSVASYEHTPLNTNVPRRTKLSNTLNLCSTHKQSTKLHTHKQKFWEELIAYFPWYDMDCIENDPLNDSSIVAYVLVAAVTFLLSRCLATIGRYTYRHIDWWEGFMKYVDEIDSGAILYMPSFIKIGSGVQKFILGIHRHFYVLKGASIYTRIYKYICTHTVDSG
jgi:hypothetical protein